MTKILFVFFLNKTKKLFVLILLNGSTFFYLNSKFYPKNGCFYSLAFCVGKDCERFPPLIFFSFFLKYPWDFFYLETGWPIQRRIIWTLGPRKDLSLGRKMRNKATTSLKLFTIIFVFFLILFIYNSCLYPNTTVCCRIIANVPF